MKNKNFSFFLIYFALFSLSKQILEKEIMKLDDLPVTDNNGFKLLVNYLNEKEEINVQINSVNEDLTNYYFRYCYTKDEDNTIILEDNKYYNEPNKTMKISNTKYIIAEIKHKNNNNKIYIKSDIINYNKKHLNKESINNMLNNKNEFKLEIFSIDFDYIFTENFPSLIIFFSTFCLATTASVILILIDLKEDKKIVKIYNLATKERAFQEYNNLKNSYITKNIFKFACFLMKFTYPIFNIFTIYNFDHPRYIRFFIILIKIVLNFLISFLLIAIFSIQKKNELIILSFIYSLIASLIIFIITELITRKYLEYDKIRKDIWKPKFENLRKYIYYTVKKDILFNSKWHFIKNRMVSYTRICGNIILRDKPDDKYKTYANNKLKSYRATLNENILSLSSGTSKNGEENELFEEKVTANTFNIRAKDSNTLLGYHMRRKKTFFAKTNENNINSRLYIEKGVLSFSISKFGQNNLKLRTVQKIEDIRNRYIMNNNESKFDETLEVNSFVKTYDNLEIETLENYTYISTDSMNSQLHNTSSESNKIFLNLIATLVLLLLLALVDFGLISVYKLMQDKLEKLTNNKKWKFKLNYIIPVIFQITIFNFLLNYFINLMICFFIFKCYGYEKKRFLYKIIFKIFVEKYIKYIYRIRLLIIKYNKELEFIDREK